MGVIVSPPVPAFYSRPRTIDDLVDHTVARMLDLFDIPTEGSPRWDGQMDSQRRVPVLPGAKEA
jgi:3-polyprenyl-4-hydroxybenzoate decarboxylase